MTGNPPKHGPIRFSKYFEIHETVLNQFKDRGFVGPESLDIVPSKQVFFLLGEIGCLGDIVIRVEKCLSILEGQGGNALIQTTWYSYNASVRGAYNIFRYDNQDEDFSFRPGHRDAHHKHVFDWQTGDETDLEWIGEQAWPTLGQVIEELHNWYWTNRELLPNANGYPEIGLR